MSACRANARQHRREPPPCGAGHRHREIASCSSHPSIPASMPTPRSPITTPIRSVLIGVPFSSSLGVGASASLPFHCRRAGALLQPRRRQRRARHRHPCLGHLPHARSRRCARGGGALARGRNGENGAEGSAARRWRMTPCGFTGATRFAGSGSSGSAGACSAISRRWPRRSPPARGRSGGSEGLCHAATIGRGTETDMSPDWMAQHVNGMRWCCA